MRSLLFVATLMGVLGAVQANAACDFTLSPNKWDADQQYNGPSPYTWWMAPCGPSTPGDGLATCKDNTEGFVGQWATGGGSCEYLMKQQTKKWQKSGGLQPSWTSEYVSNDQSRAAIISLACNGDSPGLHHQGDVTVTKEGNVFIYHFTMETNADGCASTGPADTPAPAAVTPTPGTSGSTSTIESVSASGTPSPEGHNNQTTPNPGTTVTVPSAGTESGCGGGCVFLLILGVLIPVYAVGAILWNFRVGKRGKELAPHPEIWGEVISLIKEGCIFFAQTICGCVDKCRGKGGE